MKIKKWYSALVITGLCGLILTSCTKPELDESQKEIGIIQIIEHDCLDEARKGFIDGLSELGYKDSGNIRIDYQNAQGDQAVLNSIASGFVQNKKDLILAISTPAAQAVANLTKDIPVLFTAVTDPKSSGIEALNITGTSDIVPVEKQIGLIKKLLPSAKKVAVLYCSNEINSKIQAEMAADAARKFGMETKDYTVSSTNELQQVVEYMEKSIDAVFVPTDNLVVSSMPIVSKIATSRGIPIICSEVASVKNGALATYGMDYYELGKITANQAAEILEGKNKPQNMPVQYLTDTKLTINYEIIEKLGLKIPDELRG
ncbi:MAG: ABC transporter substrate-binding protein [Oscillospiraceae bacterium]|nr:ABC transporter substrate-binding protein [Oscillospiraceae bacterium]